MKTMRRIVAVVVTAAFVLATHDLSFSAGSVPVVAAAGASSPDSVASPAPIGNTTVFGDLAHLTYTATGDLTADFVTPSDGYASPTISQRFVVTTVRDGGVELAVDGDVVPSKQIGKRVVVIKSGLTQYEYFGVLLKPGPNVVTITPLGLDGLRGPTKTATVFGPGLPVSVTATLAHPLVADGSSVQKLQIAALDRWGHPAMPGATVKIAVLEGDVKIGNAQPEQLAAAGTQPVPLPSSTPGDPTTGDDQSPDKVLEAPLGDGGTLSVPIHAGLVPGSLKLAIYSADVIQTQTFYISPYIRKPFVNGLLSIGSGMLPAAVNGDGEYDGGGSRQGRAALYGSGQVGKKSVLTFAYESQNRLQPLSSVGQFIDDPNERPYLTYGDSSQQTDNLHSNDHFFARLDSGRSSLMWGQFAADTGSAASVGSFHQLLSGAKADVNLGGAHLTAFTAKNQVAYVSQILSATGLSSLAQPLHVDIVVGSDYLTLVSLDRRTGAVLNQTPLTRNVDYTIDYATGTLRFINPPLPFDVNFDPQAVLVQYQYSGVGVASQTTGGKLAFDLGHGGGTNLEFGYVNAASGSSNYSLFSQSLSGKLPGGAWSISHADSSGQGPTTTGLIQPIGLDSGSAWHAMFNERHGFNSVSLDYQATSAGYANPYGGLSVPGFSSYRVAWQRTVPHKSEMTLEIDGQQNKGVGIDNAQAGASLSYRQYLGSRLSMLLGMNVHTQHDGITDPTGTPSLTSGTVAQTEVGIDYRPTQRLSLSVDRTSTLSGDGEDTTQPAQTVAQLTYDMDKRGKIYVRELISDAPIAAFAQATSDLSLGGNSTHATQIGIERTLSPATTVTSDYLISQTGTGTDIYSAIGVQEKFKLGKNLGGNFFVQSANASGVGATGFSVWGATLNYASPNGLRAALAYQTRSGLTGGSTLSAGFAGPINPNVSIVGALSHAYSGGSASVNDQVSLAFRPTTDDRLISLFGWQRTSGAAALESTAGAGTDVVSFEELFRPWDGFEVAGRFAYKLDGDSFYVAHTSLAGLRVRQNFGRRLDVGAEVRELNAANIPGARATDVAVEGGYQIGGGARAAVGYNFSGSVDPTLTGTPQRRGIYVTFTTLVDRIFGWGKH
jgi:hypothetical protein